MGTKFIQHRFSQSVNRQLNITCRVLVLHGLYKPASAAKDWKSWAIRE